MVRNLLEVFYDEGFNWYYYVKENFCDSLFMCYYVWLFIWFFEDGCVFEWGFFLSLLFIGVNDFSLSWGFFKLVLWIDIIIDRLKFCKWCIEVEVLIKKWENWKIVEGICGCNRRNFDLRYVL